MQKKIDFIAESQETAMEEAVKRLHIPSDKIFINVLDVIIMLKKNVFRDEYYRI